MREEEEKKASFVGALLVYTPFAFWCCYEASLCEQPSVLERPKFFSRIVTLFVTVSESESHEEERSGTKIRPLVLLTRTSMVVVPGSEKLGIFLLTKCLLPIPGCFVTPRLEPGNRHRSPRGIS